MAAGTYAIPHVTSQAQAVLTTTAPVAAYRGSGRLEAAAAIERAVDLFAAEVGLDPAEVRRRNLLPRFGAPHRTPSGAYDCGDYPVRWTPCWPQPATTSCGPSRPGAGRPVTRWRSASACRPTSR